MFDSDDDERIDPTKAKRSAAGLKSIFASDDRARQTGSQSLKYEGVKNTGGDDSFDFNTNRKNHNAGAPPVPAAGSSTIACNGAIHAYKGDQPIGAAAIVIANSNAAGTMCVIIDREKRHLCRVKVNSEQFQLLPNPQQRQYATLYDPSFQGHWTLAFKGVPECNAFLAGATTVQHFLLLPDGPRPPFVELAVADHSAGPMVKKNDTVQISLSVWLLAKKGPLTTIGKLVDEIVDEAPRRVVVGDGSVMAGVEDALIGMGVGGRKIVFIPPKKTRQNGLGNPEIGGNDTVVALVSVAGVEPYDPSMGLEDAQRSAHAGQQQAALNAQNRRERGMSTRNRSGSYASPSAASSSSAAPASASQLQQPTDTNALIQALLLKQLTEKDSKKKKKRRGGSSSDDDDGEEHEEQEQTKSSTKVSKKVTEKQLESSAFVERSLAMIQQQLAGLYEKLDRTDIAKKLDENNQKIERMVKKAVGKAPTLDVDVEDAGKDREELLAKIEQLKEKAEQHKADYYAALETMGKHKDDVVALRNDVQIAERTSQEKLQELKERHRLEVVDNEVRNRRELERVAKEQFEEGKEKGYAEGFNMGRIEGITQSGSASTEDLRDQLAKKESENIELQARLVELEAKGYEERRAALEQQATLQGLIDRLEQRNSNKEKAVIDQGAMNAKFLRRVMNSTYAHIEEQFYATEKETIAVADALSMVLISIKSETRQAADELKKLALVQSKEPTPMQPLPFETATTSAVAADIARKSPRNVEREEVSPEDKYKSSMPPPPPPPMMMSGMSATSRSSQNASAQDLSAQVENSNFELPPSNNNNNNNDNDNDEETSDTNNNNNNGAGGLDEDYIQKMLAEYRASRDKELSPAGGGDDDEEQQKQAHVENNGNDDEQQQHQQESSSRYEEHQENTDEQEVVDDDDQQQHQEEAGDDNDNNYEQEQYHHDNDEAEVEAEAADDGDEDDYEEEPVTKKAPPRPPKVAQDDDDDW